MLATRCESLPKVIGGGECRNMRVEAPENVADVNVETDGGWCVGGTDGRRCRWLKLNRFHH